MAARMPVVGASAAVCALLAVWLLVTTSGTNRNSQRSRGQDRALDSQANVAESEGDAGRPGLSISGRCVNAVTRLPVPGALVGVPEATASTAADGRFAVATDGAAAVLLEIRAEGFAIVTVPWSDRLPSDLGDIQLRPMPCLEGMVRNAEGGPAAGATIFLMGEDGSLYRETTASENGSFRLPIIEVLEQRRPAGSVRAWLAGHGAASQSFGTPPRSVSLCLDAGRALGGAVVDARSRRPLPGVGVFVQPKGSRQVDDLMKVGETDEAGMFRVAAFASLQSSVVFRKAGYATWMEEYPKDGVLVPLEPAGVIAGTVVLPDGQPAGDSWVALEGLPTALLLPPSRSDAGGRFRLADAPLARKLTVVASRQFERGSTGLGGVPDGEIVVRLEPEPGCRRIAVRVVDGSGAAVPGVTVTLTPSVGMRGEVTDAQGAAAFGASNGWSFPVVVLAIGRDLIGLSEAPIVLSEWRDPQVVVARRAVAVVGRVMAPVVDSPIEIRTLVDGEPPIPICFTMPDAGGRFAATAPPGRSCVLTVRGAGTAPQLVQVKAPDADVVDLGDLRLGPGRSIRGRVTTRKGTPVADAYVTCEKAEWTRWVGEGLTTGSDKDGAFELRDVPPAPFDVRVRTPSGLDAAVVCVSEADFCQIVLPLD